jgi:hypothetical protein
MASMKKMVQKEGGKKKEMITVEVKNGPVRNRKAPKVGHRWRCNLDTT